MAKKRQEDAVKPQESQTPHEQAQTQTATGADNTESAVENAGESQAGDKEGQVIVPIGYSVKLREIHPQASYGRCGYRFNKTEVVYLPVEELAAEQVLTLAEDPWLELIPVCEG